MTLANVAELLIALRVEMAEDSISDEQACSGVQAAIALLCTAAPHLELVASAISAARDGKPNNLLPPRLAA